MKVEVVQKNSPIHGVYYTVYYKNMLFWNVWRSYSMSSDAIKAAKELYENGTKNHIIYQLP